MWCHPATFMMGEKGEPRHKVTIAKPFAVRKFAVTCDQWDACVSGGGCDDYRPTANSWGQGTRPVINVSWDEAKGTLTWLTRMTGKSYRLLSEAEWEYARAASPARCVTPPIPGATTSAKSNANYGTDQCGSQWRDGTMVRRLRSDQFQRRTPSVSMTCMATSGSGSRTPGMTTIAERPEMVALGQKVEKQVAVSFVAALGTTIQSSSARPTASGSPPTIGTTTWASGSVGRLLLESLLLYLLGSRGEAPGRIF